jgi:flagellar biosynthesis GTPase FlhF
MKKKFLLVGLVLASFGAYSFTAASTTSSVEIKQGVAITFNVSSSAGPVAGALIKITNNGMTIGAATTDATGKSTINIPQYNGQIVQIEVSHALYKSGKLIDQTLENGKSFTISLKAKTDTAESVIMKSEEKVEKIEGKTEEANKKAEEEAKKAEEYKQNKENAVKSQEELRKEKEEAQRIAEEKQRNAEATMSDAEKKQAEAEKQRQETERMKSEKQAQVEREAKAREDEAKKRDAEAAARQK